MSQAFYYQQFLNHNRYPRSLIPYEGDEASSVYIKQGDKTLINFSSSDYLGLAKHPAVIQRSQDYAKQFGVGAGSSRLVTAPNTLFSALEDKLAKQLQKPAALILATGYQTNTTVLEALLDKNVLQQKAIVFCDKYCHVSMMAGALHHAELQRYQHNDLAHLERLLVKAAPSSRPLFILAESIYSMEGDALPFKKLIHLAKQYKAFLYIDDAHSVGVMGRNGWGLASDYANDIDVIMGTFSKAMGSLGGYIACSEMLKDYLVNKCRGFIYSTALPMPVLGAISAAIEWVPQLTSERERIAAHTQKLLSFFRRHHLNCGSSESHIIPWIIHDENQTLRASELLKAEGILGVTIRPPSVPPKQSRIRFCITADHQDAHIEQLMTAILKIAEKIL